MTTKKESSLEQDLLVHSMALTGGYGLGNPNLKLPTWASAKMEPTNLFPSGFERVSFRPLNSTSGDFSGVGTNNDHSFSPFPPHISFHASLAARMDSSKGGGGEPALASTRMTPQEILEAKALVALRNHSEAERRRRERINSHLAMLRTLVPSSSKSDKASLLANVIQQLKSLKQQASEIYELGPMPTDVDELKVEKDLASSMEGKLLIKASLCCEDRPELFSDLIRAIDSLRLVPLKAEISTLGGRSRNVILLTVKGNTSDLEVGEGGGPLVNNVHEALRRVMESPSVSEVSLGSSNKRPKLGTFESA